MSKPPRPTYTLTISICACDWERLIEQLREKVDHVADHGPICDSCWGGAGTHGHVRIEHHADVTPESYEKALHEWWMALRAEKDADDVREEVREHRGG